MSQGFFVGIKMLVEIVPQKGNKNTKFILKEDVVIFSHLIRKGFVTDGASVPRIVWAFISPVGEIFYPAVLHDYLIARGYTWVHAAKVFNGAMKDYEVGTLKRLASYYAVRLWGLFR